MEVMKMKGVVKYEAYKDSGEYWMGEIPKHWRTLKLKHIFNEKKIKHNPELGCGAISFGTVIEKEDEKIPLSTKASYQEVLEGEFLVNPLNLNYDLKSLRIALSGLNVVVSSGYIVLQNHEKIDKHYYKYLLHRYDVAYMKLLGSGVRQTINFNHISNSLLAYPPLLEQTAIATFLDEKTAKIDQAIAQKEQLIALLKERKQILIQELVTGKKVWDEATQSWVEPKETIESGVEWIGEIPKGWKVLRVASILRQTNIPGEEGLSVLSVSIHSAVSDRELTDEENIRGTIRSDDKSVYKKVDKGDIVYNMMRAWQGAIGSVSVIGMVSPAYVTARFIKSFNSNYFEYLFRTPDFINLMNQYSRGITDFRKRLYWNEFKQLPILQPPINEQNRIVDFINSYSVAVDSSMSNCQLQIEKLKEYKTVLIDSVVTGKIKVC